MNPQTEFATPVEIIAEWSDSMPDAAMEPRLPKMPLQPGEGRVECAIIQEFADSAAKSRRLGADLPQNS